MSNIQKLGPYRIQRMIGRGGMGTVYSAVHEETGETAAVKQLFPSLKEDGNFRERFALEIDSLRRLNHPNIVRLFGEGEQDGSLFYAMELVEGKSLQVELQQRKSFTPSNVIQIGIDVCEALKHAHDHGIVHRDLKPANLLRTADGNIKLTDFGIAKLFGSTSLTAAGSVIGTADFMAPEQAGTGPVTAKSDLYSLGSVMFALLARQAPFRGESVAHVIHQVRSEPAPSIRQFVPNVPLELEEIIAQLLAKDPAERVPTALVLANRLKAMQHALSKQAESDTSETDDDNGEEDLPNGWDRPTNVSCSSEAPATHIAPTAADQSNVVSPADYSWNNATVVTDRGTSPPPPAEESEVKSTNRFTMVEDEVPETSESTKKESHLSTIGLAAAFVVLVGMVGWAMWPIDADTLYARITKTAAFDLSDASDDITEFLERFPDDSRAEEVRLLHGDLECKRLQSQLALAELKSGGSGLKPHERLFLDACRLKEKAPQQARAKFLALVSQYSESAETSPGLQRYVGLARHQVNRLAASP